MPKVSSSVTVCKAYAQWQPTSLRRAILTSPRELDTLHLTSGGGTTLCGKRVSRTLNIFAPNEAGCRECKRRWQLAVAAEAAKPPKQPPEKNAASMAMGCLVLVVILLVVGGIITGIVLLAVKGDTDAGQPAKGMLAHIPGCAITSGTNPKGGWTDLGSSVASEATCTLPDGTTVTLATWGSTNPQADDPQFDTENQEEAVYNDTSYGPQPPNCCIMGNSPTAWIASIDEGAQSDWSTVEQALGGHAVTSAPASWNTGTP
jgi:hypothetical protein